jgi:hypothetical protein
MHLAVHLLTDEDRSFTRLFGEQIGDQIDKFTQMPRSLRRPA